MKIDIKRNMIYFYFNSNEEEFFLFNTINFTGKILEEAKTKQKDMYIKIKKILKKIESNTLLQRLDNLEYIAHKEDILILFDNAIFIIKDLKKDKNAKHMKESYNLIEEILENIVSYIKEENNKESKEID
jgi:hypothetical protein